MEKETLPVGVRIWGKKYRSHISVNRKQVYLGIFPNIEEAVKAQVDHRTARGLPAPIRGRPKKS